jgi:DNA-binding transcriptional regulator LsrR (DeoR family)
MLTVETIGRIRRERFVNGKTIRQIARDLRVSRNTVRKVLHDAEEQNATHESIAPTRIILCRLPIDIVDLSQ